MSEHVLCTNSVPLSVIYENHPNSFKLINRIICNVLYNNWQKREKHEVGCDVVKEFKQRKRTHEE